ncbi:hypothetical protein SAMN05518684_107188 [Salipaludibacillus aurantiacus]|uniref:Uncharacterized protein n=1 Tax=Salipaludibacillus aurantiacus TaxID=1601833 RepID=A0A1H9UGH4_9BACI|nr:hypothetical protein SAMN05518684_107188 [Salipaludibacillus aurantiacus]
MNKLKTGVLQTGVIGALSACGIDHGDTTNLNFLELKV